MLAALDFEWSLFMRYHSFNSAVVFVRDSFLTRYETRVTSR